ncbi:YdeI/OmpD-associated family protein [soil metagenome]
MDPRPDDLILPFATGAAFERWLAKHHATVTLVWIKYAKKGSGEPSIAWPEAVDVALCHGWIDGQSKSLDTRYYLQRFTPRRATSAWSKINRDRVARLIADGRMRPAGLAEVARAKADGRWDAAYDSPKTAVVPDDLATALSRSPVAKAAFAGLAASSRYTILYRLQNAKRLQTRARQIATCVATLEAPAKIRNGGDRKP